MLVRAADYLRYDGGLRNSFVSFYRHARAPSLVFICAASLSYRNTTALSEKQEIVLHYHNIMIRLVMHAMPNSVVQLCSTFMGTGYILSLYISVCSAANGIKLAL